MPSIYDLKSKFQSLLRPLVNVLAGQHITANQVTLFAVFISLLVGALIALFPGKSWVMLLVPIALFVRMALNAIDGMLAHEFDMKTNFGALLNELGDVISDTALFLPFCYISGVNSIYIVVIVLLSIISEMTGVIAIQIGASRRYDGPMGKSDRAFVFGTVALLFAMGVTPGFWTDCVWFVVTLLLALTIYNRSRKALREAADV